MGDPPVPAPGATENDVSDEKKIVKTDPFPALRIVHVCAAAEDRAVLTALVKQLTGVHVTHAGDIRAGGTTDIERRALLDAADVIVLLVSADFVASPEHETDVARALERHAAKAVRLVPVLCRPCTWEGLPYAGLLALPRDKQPLLVGQALREDALAEVARELRALVAEPAEIDAACPFPGLEFFGEERAADFFGREAQITEALGQLSESRPARRWLQIDGPSGAGKSSFARAGIIPAVRDGKLVVGPKAWITVVIRPGYDPIASLAEALVMHAKPSLHVKGSLDAVTKELSSSTTALKSFLREHVPEGSGVLLVVDQLEEAFTLAHADENGVKQFDALIATALDDREGPLVLITTIRSDFVARMGELPALEKKLPTQAVRYYLRSMDEAGLHAAIEKPAERIGLAYEEGLVDRIVADASTSRGALPLVAHVLEALYTQRERRRLTARVYDLVGGVGGALAKSADAIIDGLDEEGRTRARKLLLRLVKIGRGSEDTRQTATREVALGAAGGGPEAERVLARLSGGRVVGLGGTTSAFGRLVVVSGEEGKERVDLVHEALIQRWGTLRVWIKDAREELELRDDVEEAARIWEASESPEDGLPRGTALARFRGVDRDALQEGARKFLDAAEEAEKRAAEEKRTREEEKRKAAEERARFQRRVIVGLLAFVVALGIAAGVAIWQRNEAQGETKRADKAAKSAEQETKIANVRRLAAQSTTAGEGGFFGTQLQLAIEARNTAILAELPFYPPSEQALLDAIHDRPTYVRLSGHDGPVVMAKFSRDGRIVTASRDGTARVWNADGMGSPVVLRGHRSEVFSAEFSPNAQLVLTVSKDKTARVWRADGEGTPIILQGHGEDLSMASFSPDGSWIVIASSDKVARVWRTDGLGSTILLRGHNGPIKTAFFSHDGKHIVTASDDKTVRVWGFPGTRDTVVLVGHEAGVNSAMFSPDDRYVITASADGQVRVFNADGHGQPVVHDVCAKGGPVTSAMFTSDGQSIICKSTQGGRLLRATPRSITSAPAAPNPYGLAVSPDRRWLLHGMERATGSGVNVTRLTVDGISIVGQPFPLDTDSHDITYTEFGPDGRVVTASEDGAAHVWTLQGLGGTSVLRHASQVTSATFSPDGQRIITTSNDGVARVWSRDAGSEPLVLRGHDNAIERGVFSPDGKRIVTVSRDKTARLWSVDGVEDSLVLRGHEHRVTCAAFSANGERIATGSLDQTVRIWDTKGRGEAVVLRGHQGSVNSVAFSRDGNRVVSASSDRTVMVWNVGAPNTPIAIWQHSGSVAQAFFDADDKRIISATDDGIVSTIEPNGEQTSVSLSEKRGGRFRLTALSNDGRSAVTLAFGDSTARLWRLDEPSDPVILRGHRWNVLGVAFSPDGKYVVTTSADETARVWTIDGNLLACGGATWQRSSGDKTYWDICPKSSEPVGGSSASRSAKPSPTPKPSPPPDPMLLPSADPPLPTVAPPFLP